MREKRKPRFGLVGGVRQQSNAPNAVLVAPRCVFVFFLPALPSQPVAVAIAIFPLPSHRDGFTPEVSPRLPGAKEEWR